MNFTIAALKEDDWPAALEIYRQGIATRNATFETELPSWQKWDAGHLRHCRIVRARWPGGFGMGRAESGILAASL